MLRDLTDPSLSMVLSSFRKENTIYAINRTRRMAPSMRERIFPPARPNMTRRRVAAMLIGISRLRLVGEIAIGRISDVTPRISRVLKMLEPITLPTAMSALPLIAPMKLTTISGAEVPMPTIVRPITNSLTPSLRAIDDDPSTRISDPTTTRTRPRSNSRMSNHNISREFRNYFRLQQTTFSTCIVWGNISTGWTETIS